MCLIHTDDETVLRRKRGGFSRGTVTPSGPPVGGYLWSRSPLFTLMSLTIEYFHNARSRFRIETLYRLATARQNFTYFCQKGYLGP